MLSKEDESMSIEKLGSYEYHLLDPLNAVLRIFSACDVFVGEMQLKLLNGDVAYMHPIESIHAELGGYVPASPRRHDGL